MKKLAIMSMTFLLVMAVVQIQAQEKGKETKKEVKAERKALRKLERSEVSPTSKRNLQADFGNLSNVKWKTSDYFDEATFTKDGHEMTAFYDFKGELVGTTLIKTFADVPANGQKSIKKQYKDYSVGPVIFFDDNEANDTDMLLYGVQFDDEDNYFVELTKGNSKIIERVNIAGDVFFFKQL
jgi:hypothetical protein